MNSSTPPPLPPTVPPLLYAPLSLGGPVMLNGQIVVGTQGMTVADVSVAVARGGRFVFYQYCFSVLILTFKRSSPLTFIPPGGSAVRAGMRYSLISLLAGWWGIPWGPIFTFWTLGVNLQGGKDVTREALHDLGLNTAMPAPRLTGNLVAPPAASRPGKPVSSWKLKVATVAVMCLSVGTMWFGYKVVQAVRHRQPTPHVAAPAGMMEFHERNNQIRGAHRVDAGNKPEAHKMATEMSLALRKRRQHHIEAAAKTSALDAHDAFLTYCELDAEKCVFLCHVPELRRFTEEAKQSFGQLAWLEAQRILRSNDVRHPGMKVAVAIRGIVIYDRVLLGKYVPDGDKQNAGLTSVEAGGGCERWLYPWFASATNRMDGAAP